jgi:hypothetical protein
VPTNDSYTTTMPAPVNLSTPVGVEPSQQVTPVLSTPNTPLKNGSVYPDRWSKMDVGMAKDMLKRDTMNDMVLHWASEL